MRRATPLRLPLLLLSITALLAAAGTPCPVTRAAEDMSRLEEEAAAWRTKIAKIWLDLAHDLAERDVKEQAEDALARARALDPELDGLAEVGDEVRALSGEGSVDAAVARLLDKANRAAAKAYDRLAGVFEREQADPRYARYLVRAMALDPSKSRRKRLADLAKKEPLLMGDPSHPFVGLVSLPRGWKSGREWPVLVCVEGEGSLFDAHALRFLQAGGSRKWIVVTPHALSGAHEVKFDRYPAYDRALIEEWNLDRLAFDLDGLVGLLDFLREHFGAAERVVITGFSRGSRLCYGLLLRHPDRILGAASVCGHFDPAWFEEIEAVEDGGPPVLLLTGADDPERAGAGEEAPGIEAQGDLAVKTLQEHGFTNLRRTLLEGVGHDPCPDEVWAFADEAAGE